MSETPAEPTPSEAKKNAGPRTIVLGLVALAGVTYGVKTWSFNQSHVTTDDAYVTNDVIPISPEEAGKIGSVDVLLNHHVKAGDTLFTLDPEGYAADLKQVEANLAVAQAAASSGKASVDLTTMTGEAQQAQASGGVSQASADLGSARLGVIQAQSGVASLKSAEEVAQSQYVSALDAIKVRQADVQRAREQLASVNAQLADSRAKVLSAQANLKTLQNQSKYASRESARYDELLTAGAVSASQAEQKHIESDQAQSALAAGREMLTGAQSSLTSKEADLKSAQVAVQQALLSVQQARSQATALQKGVDASKAHTAQAVAAAHIAEQSIQAAQARVAQAMGKLREASVVEQKKSISEGGRRTADAKVLEAEAALAKAQLAMKRTTIKAPVGGMISKKSLEIGQQVTSGQPLMALIPDQLPWVIANFKETQVGRIRVGQEVEIEVDALSGRTYRGHVDSISGGTGSTFALLPADNATGNFTKVVQRVPVKIVLESNQEHLDDLRAGLSTTVVIHLK